jgi:hypothetical protein
LAQHKIVTTLGLGREGQKANIVGISRCCDLIHSVAGFADSGTTEAAVKKLRETSDDLAASDRIQPDTNDPNAAAAPQSQPSTTEDKDKPSRFQRRSIPADSLGE